MTSANISIDNPFSSPEAANRRKLIDREYAHTVADILGNTADLIPALNGNREPTISDHTFVFDSSAMNSALLPESIQDTLKTRELEEAIIIITRDDAGQPELRVTFENDDETAVYAHRSAEDDPTHKDSLVYTSNRWVFDEEKQEVVVQESAPFPRIPDNELFAFIASLTFSQKLSAYSEIDPTLFSNQDLLSPQLNALLISALEDSATTQLTHDTFKLFNDKDKHTGDLEYDLEDGQLTSITLRLRTASPLYDLVSEIDYSPGTQGRIAFYSIDKATDKRFDREPTTDELKLLNEYVVQHIRLNSPVIVELVDVDQFSDPLDQDLD